MAPRTLCVLRPRLLRCIVVTFVVPVVPVVVMPVKPRSLLLLFPPLQMRIVQILAWQAAADMLTARLQPHPACRLEHSPRMTQSMTRK